MRSQYRPRHIVLAMLAAWLNQEQEKQIAYLREEIRTLREQSGGKKPRYTDRQRARLATKAQALKRAVLDEMDTLVTPDTLRRWYRELIARKYDGSAKRRPGRPRKPEEIRQLVMRLAGKNLGWGYTRIRDVMWHLGHEIARTTVSRILQEQGMEPAPERLRHMPWAKFLKTHWGAIAATDFFDVEVMTWHGPVRYAVLFVMDLKTRVVEIAGILPEPHEAWMMQIGRNLLDAFDGFLLPMRKLIMDRDPRFTERFRGLLGDSGVEPIRLPPRSPNLNAYAERFVRSIKEECLEQAIPLGERHLREMVREYVAHYHAERPHQGLGGRTIVGGRSMGAGRVRRHERLGGLLNHYDREAA